MSNCPIRFGFGQLTSGRSAPEKMAVCHMQKKGLDLGMKFRG